MGSTQPSTKAPTKASPKGPSTSSNQLTPGETRVLSLAFQLTDPTKWPRPDMNELARVGGYKTRASANSAWYNVIKKIIAQHKVGGALKDEQAVAPGSESGVKSSNAKGTEVGFLQKALNAATTDPETAARDRNSSGSEEKRKHRRSAPETEIDGAVFRTSNDETRPSKKRRTGSNGGSISEVANPSVRPDDGEQTFSGSHRRRKSRQRKQRSLDPSLSGQGVFPSNSFRPINGPSFYAASQQSSAPSRTGAVKITTTNAARATAVLSTPGHSAAIAIKREPSKTPPARVVNMKYSAATTAKPAEQMHSSAPSELTNNKRVAKKSKRSLAPAIASKPVETTRPAGRPSQLPLLQGHLAEYLQRPSHRSNRRFSPDATSMRVESGLQSLLDAAEALSEGELAEHELRDDSVMGHDETRV